MGLEIQEGNIADVQDCCKYFGIPQANENCEEAIRKSGTAKYILGVRQVLRSQPTGQNKVRATKRYTLPIIRYAAGIITSPKEEIPAPDIKTRKLLTRHG